MSTQTPAHVSITSKQEQMNYHSHQSVFISQDGCQCRQSPAVPLLSCHLFSLTSFFDLSFCYLPVACPHPPTHSVYSFITLDFPSCLHPLSLSHSLHLSPLSRSFLKLPEVLEPAARAKPFGPFSQIPLSFCFSFLLIQPSETPNPVPRV